MVAHPLVTCEELSGHLGDPNWVVFDVRFDLADKEKGLREYGKQHIPGSYYAHVERDLSGPVGTGGKGRHPLPIPGAFQRFLGLHGITADTVVVAYDDQAGQWASRLWWLARHYGVKDVRVLDGGLTRWKALRLPLGATHEKARRTVSFTGSPGHMPTVDLPQVMAAVAAHQDAATGPGPSAHSAGAPLVLVDARAPERYRGDLEPVDKRAGHIPGARNVPYIGNVGPDMLFLPPQVLRQRFLDAGVPPISAQALQTAGEGNAESSLAAAGSSPEATTAVVAAAPAPLSASQMARAMTKEERRGHALTAPTHAPAAQAPRSASVNVACYCGSGVTGTNDVLAMELAGLGTPALYPGSWSEWCHDPGRPAELGPAAKP